MANRLIQLFNTNRFNFISWGVTGLVVAGLLGSTLLWTQRGLARPESPTETPAQNHPTTAPPKATGDNLNTNTPSIARELLLKTDMSEKAKLAPVSYKVTRGDSVFGIAKQFNIKPDSILFSNEATLNDNPANISPGMVLQIPPVDGMLYTWKAGDTVESVADEFKAKPDDILNFPGNNLDLTNPQIKPGTVVMIPGGQRELVAWLEFVPTSNRNGGSTATSELGGSGCKGGYGSPPGIWPTTGPHTISGNDYSPTHLGIDITATLNMPVLASGAGTVVFAGFSQYGYGNVIQIDHGDGFSTVYAHLNGFNVTQCQTVEAGQVIGYAGTTGNSTGVHLHFEVREGGVNVNPWGIVQ